MPRNLDMRSIERGTNFSHVSSTTVLQREGKNFQADKFPLFPIRFRIQSLRHITRCGTRSRTNDRIRQRRKTSRGIGSLSWSSLPRMSSPIRINNPPATFGKQNHSLCTQKKTEHDTLGPLSRNLRRFSLTRRNRTSSWYVFFLLPPINFFVCCFPQIRELTFFSFHFMSFLEHCVDYLRQYIQCNADLTPMWTGDMGGGHLMVKPYTPHTCRDFDQITQWIDDHRV